MDMVKVVNHNEMVLKGRYDGKDYVFKPEKPVEMPLDAAAHIFGLGHEDKAEFLNRLGLLIPGKDTLEEATEKLDQISFHRGRTVFDDEATPPGETDAAAPEGDGTPEPGDAPTSLVPVGGRQRRARAPAASDPG